MKSNKLIAEFMGHQVNFGFKKDGVLFLRHHIGLDKLKYDSSWDWLRPVVLKIEQDCEGVPQEMLNISLYSDIDEVYKSVVEFIKNQNKK